MNGRNPLFPSQFHIPDGEAHVMPDGRVYLYGSLDQTTDGFCSQEYYVASSKDMQSWTIHPGQSFSSGQVPWGIPGGSRHHSSLSEAKCFDDLPSHIKNLLPASARELPVEQIIHAIEAHSQMGVPKDLRLYAPDAIEKDGIYYLYFCMSDDSEGVAVSEHPQGPFTDPVRLPVQGIDPAVFVDTDGQAYYYWGQFSANGAKLNADMKTLDESTIVQGILTEKQHHFHEGSSVRKRGDTYYYVFSDVSRGKPTCLGYATSKSPLGPFTYQGVIIDNASCDPASWNNHGSIEEINGQWYVFYHRSCNNSQYLRRACAEPIFFDENGFIREVKMTSQGAGIPLAPGETIPAIAACGFGGNAYLKEAETGDCVIYAEGNGKVTFRYLKCDTDITTLNLQCSGEAGISVLSDGILVGEGNCRRPIPILIQPGLHEITLMFTSAKDFTVDFLCFATELTVDG